MVVQESKPILVVAGARPNFMKAKPVIDSLADLGANVRLVHTGQHYDPSMSDVFFIELGLRVPDFRLEVGSGSHAVQTSAVMTRFEELVEKVHPAAVVVLGDINSTLACAIVGAKSGAIVVHVEAGLRSRDWTMPEEVNRIATDHLSDLLLAPSPDAVENLRAEGFREDQIALVGNVMVDTLLANVERAQERNIVREIGTIRESYALLTLHRPSNVDSPGYLVALLDAISSVNPDLTFVFPVHPRTRMSLEGVSVPKNVVLLEPLGYLDFVSLMSRAVVVLTDSGGVQEETTVLGVPCLTVRNNTERPITVTEGTNRLVGTDPRVVANSIRETLASPPSPRRPELWDGHAGRRCAEAILAVLNNPQWKRPTSN